MDFDEVGIQYSRHKLRFQYERGQTGTILCLLPPEGAEYLLEESELQYQNEHGAAITFVSSERDENGGRVSDRAQAPGPTTAERMSTMKAKIRRERTTDKSKGVRLRYDMPNNLAKTSLAEGGFNCEREAE